MVLSANETSEVYYMQPIGTVGTRHHLSRAPSAPGNRNYDGIGNFVFE